MSRASRRSTEAADDARFMRLALREARRAERAGEVPVGAVVVAAGGAGQVVGRGHNLTISRHDPTAHAEVVALRRAARRGRNYRLTGVTLYVTLEPCLMCLGALTHARVGRIVFGAPDPKRGAMRVARTRRITALLHHELLVTGGVMSLECGSLLREFFRPRR